MTAKHFRRFGRGLGTGPRGVTAAAVLAAALLGPAAATMAAASPPYPQSAAIGGVSFRWETHHRLASGSDNWPLTWAADGHQYTAFGDGGGFGGDEANGRVSLGFARVEGPASAYRGYNVWGGAGADAAATLTGKSYGVLAVGDDLYMWRCGAGSRATAFDFQQLHRSTNGGRSWQNANWMFPASVTFYCPAFLQFGKGNAGAPDGYAYMYAVERTSDVWQVHVPGKITLMRVPAARLMERSPYQWFAGMDSAGQPRWSSDMDDRQPVFEDPNGAHLVSVAYNPGLRRYLLATVHGEKDAADVGIFDAPTPWGPWGTVLYEDGWGAGHVETSTFFLNFSPKWWSAEGRDFVLAFTGGDSLDAWNTVEGTFILGSGTGPGSESSAPPDRSDGAPSSGTTTTTAVGRGSPAPADSGEVSAGAARRAREACREIAGNRNWTGVTSEIRDRRNADGRVVAVVRGQRQGEDRERRCKLETTIDKAWFDDQER